MPTPKKNTIAESLERLEGIVTWLDDQDQIHVEEGLAKVKEGAVLVRELKARLKEVANDFAEVKRELEDDDQA